MLFYKCWPLAHEFINMPGEIINVGYLGCATDATGQEEGDAQQD